MALHTLRIDVTASQASLTLLSVATWVRGPGCVLRVSSGGGGVTVEMHDRHLLIDRAKHGEEAASLSVQVATTEERLTVWTEQSGDGALTVRAAADSRTIPAEHGIAVTMRTILFLTPIEQRRSESAGG
jgi:hypothetical protein